jgi:SAM-dependent methyltransferase
METVIETPQVQSDAELKRMVKEKYSAIALQSKEQNAASCCGATAACCDPVYNVMAEDYATQSGYVKDADLGLGCGIPTQFVDIKPGTTVLDLGSGAGNDAFVARSLVGETGKVIGVDFSEPMIDKARANAETLGYNNVEFRYGDIEHLPVAAGRIDLILSNCVLNLVPNKARVFEEMYRVLKPGGSFCVSDIVLGVAALPQKMQHTAELYAGCVSGAIPKAEYLGHIHRAGFDSVMLAKERPITVPDDILTQYLTPEELAQYKALGTPILSVTVKGTKPLNTPCCTPGSGCC